MKVSSCSVWILICFLLQCIDVGVSAGVGGVGLQEEAVVSAAAVPGRLQTEVLVIPSHSYSQGQTYASEADPLDTYTMVLSIRLHSYKFISNVQPWAFDDHESCHEETTCKTCNEIALNHSQLCTAYKVFLWAVYSLLSLMLLVARVRGCKQKTICRPPPGGRPGCGGRK